MWNSSRRSAPATFSPTSKHMLFTGWCRLEAFFFWVMMFTFKRRVWPCTSIGLTARIQLNVSTPHKKQRIISTRTLAVKVKHLMGIMNRPLATTSVSIIWHHIGINKTWAGFDGKNDETRRKGSEKLFPLKARTEEPLDDAQSARLRGCNTQPSRLRSTLHQFPNQ